MSNTHSLKSVSNSSLSDTLKKWKMTYLISRRSLLKGACKSIEDAAIQQGVNCRLLTRYAKRFDIKIGLKGHGVIKPRVISPEQEKSSDLWSLTALSRAA